MNGHFREHGVCGVVFASLVLAASAQEVPLATAPQEGVVLLCNGHALRGRVTRVGDFYRVAVHNGEIRLRADQVEFVCRDLEEGYRRKRATIKVGNVTDHLRLTHWCLRHNLLDHAADELIHAANADPRHPAIELFRRRLTLAIEPPKNRTPSAQPIESGPSFEELDALAREMPPGTVERFTQTIQPVLVNNCATAGCHGPQSKAKFQLARIPKGRPPSRRMTQKNLHAVLQWIDRENPTSSRLLTVPIEPHGTARKPIFTEHQLHQYKRMVDWVCDVAGLPGAQVPATVTQAARTPVQAMPNGKMLGDLRTATPPQLLPPEATNARPLAAEAGPPSKVTPASYLKSITEDGSGPKALEPSNPFSEPADPPKEPNPLLLLRPEVQRGARIKKFTPVDPFDPAIFNRKFFGEPKEETPPAGQQTLPSTK